MSTTLGTAPHSWRFYGREAEIESLKKHLYLDVDDLKQRRFGAFIVAGRRHVGKNALLMETHRRHGNKTPLLTVELPEDTNAEECLNELMSTIQNRNMSLFMHNMPERGSYCRDATRFADVIRHLVDQGIIVCLDEFHNAYRTGLESALKVIIDQIALVFHFNHIIPILSGPDPVLRCLAPAKGSRRMFVVVGNAPFHRCDAFRQRVDDGMLEPLTGQFREEALRRMGP